jgi:hypothetical protein
MIGKGGGGAPDDETCGKYPARISPFGEPSGR